MSLSSRLGSGRVLRRLPLLLMALLLTASAALGCSPPWQIIRQAMPSPLAGQRQLGVEPLHFESVSIGGKPEGEYLSDKEDKSRQSWAADKAESAQLFLAELRKHAPDLMLNDAAAGPAPFYVRPIVNFWEPGFYVGVAAGDAKMAITLQVIDEQGLIVDEVLLAVQVPANLFNPSSGGRMRSAAETLGERVAAYLRSRVFPGQ